MNVPSQSPQPTNTSTTRRRRKTPRGVPSVIQQRERRPFAFGWGAHLTNREREALKEKIALFGGIAIGIVILALFGWGWYQDNVATPAAKSAANNKPVAQVGSDTIRMGFFKRYETFQSNQLNSQLQQVQQALPSLQANPKKNAVQLAQAQQEEQLLNSQLSNLAQNSLTALIDSSVILQRAWTAAVTLTPAQFNTAWTQQETSAGGPIHLQQFITSSGMTVDEFKNLVRTQELQKRLTTKLQANVPHVQTEVRASHILIPTAKQAVAKKVYDLARKPGANFAALAKKYSTDPGSVKKGGDLGYFPRGQMVSQFDQAAFSMKVGQIKLVKSDLGWHIINVTGRKKIRLSAKDYANAKQNAFTNWLNAQKAKISVRYLVAVQNLPTTTSTSTGATSSLPSQQILNQPPPVTKKVVVPSRHVVPKASKSAAKTGSGKSGNNTAKH